jgi:MFS family permease
MTGAAAPDSGPRGGFAAFRHRDFTIYWFAQLCQLVPMQMMAVAIGWQVYEITSNPLDLGLIGLAEFLPVPLLVLLAGHAADRFERRFVIQLSDGARALMALALLKITSDGAGAVWPFYVLALAMGVTRAFGAPAGRAMLPDLVPLKDLSNAVAWRSSGFQASFVVGPALGGVLYAGMPESVYGVAALLLAASVLMMFLLRPHPVAVAAESPDWASLVAGIILIKRKPLLLGAISLDLFAVLLGGVTALLPIFARDILDVGVVGLGVLRLAPAVGAIVMAVTLAYFPLQRGVGRTLYLGVAIFGLATIVFALSTSFVLSLAALAVLGAADLVSVIVRSTVVPLATPDHMRGRVTAVEMVFIGASNELGMFESGLLAWLIGTVPAALLGGIGTLLVVLLWIRLFPDLYKVDRLDHRL